MSDWFAALAPVALGGVSAGGSISSSIIQSNANKEINKQNIAMQRETNALQKDMFERNLAWQRESQDLQNDYNSLESQIQRALIAGVSPAALFESSNGSVPASLGSAGSGIPALTAPHADFVKEPLTEFVSQAAILSKVMADVSGSQLNTAQKNEIVGLLEGKIKSLDLSNEAQTIANGLQMKYGDKKLDAEVNLMVAQASKEIASTALDQQKTLSEVVNRVNTIADTLYKQVQTKLGHKELAVFDKKFALWKQDTIESIKVKRTEQTENLAAAEEHRAGAKDKYALADLHKSQDAALEWDKFLSHQKTEFFKKRHRIYVTEPDGSVKSYSMHISDIFSNEFRDKLYDLRNKDGNYRKLYEEVNKIEKEGKLIEKDVQWYGIKTVFNMMTDAVDSFSELWQFFKPRLNASDVQVDSKPYDYQESEEPGRKYYDENGDVHQAKKKIRYYRKR